MACNCNKEWTKLLRERYNESACINADVFSGRVVINGLFHKQRKDGSYQSKWEEVGLWPNFCPFCGEPYESDYQPSDEQLRCMTHAIGLDQKEPDKHGVYEAYRNGSFYDKRQDEWEELRKRGLAIRREPAENDVRYFVTKRGFQTLARHHRLMIRFNEEYEGRE